MSLQGNDLLLIVTSPTGFGLLSFQSSTDMLKAHTYFAELSSERGQAADPAAAGHPVAAVVLGAYDAILLCR